MFLFCGVSRIAKKVLQAPDGSSTPIDSPCRCPPPAETPSKIRNGSLVAKSIPNLRRSLDLNQRILAHKCHNVTILIFMPPASTCQLLPACSAPLSAPMRRSARETVLQKTAGGSMEPALARGRWMVGFVGNRHCHRGMVLGGVCIHAPCRATQR